MKKITSEQAIEAFKSTGSIRQAAALLSVDRSTVRRNLKRVGALEKPLVGGSLHGRRVLKASLPPKGIVKRYILTSAQNNTAVNEKFWNSLLLLADYYDANLYVGTFTYNQNHFGQLAVKRGTKKSYEHKLWYASEIKPYIKDFPIELAPGLTWCGEMNILPTAVDPLTGLETYTHRSSSIFPHVKIAMRSIATMQGEGTKLMYTTGTVTQRNYVQKKEGIKAEHHHRYAALVVEVNDAGNWFVRQIGMGSRSGVLQDLNVVVEDGKVRTDGTIEAVTFGDLHAACVEPEVVAMSMDILDSMKPKYQFIHDVLEGASINRHERKHKSVHQKFSNWLRGLHRLEAELKTSSEILAKYLRPWCKTVIPDSNHDGPWLKDWLRDFDYRVDPGNAEIFLRLQAFMYSEIRSGKMPKNVNIISRAFAEVWPYNDKVKFLLADESFAICNRKIECGMHGHLGPNGAPGSPANLSKVGRRANTAHTHSTGIYNGLYVAGTSSKLKWDYTYGPSSWSHSHIFTYPNGQRTIVTMYGGRWRA